VARSHAPELFPLFRSRLQGELLAYVLISPEVERSASDIAEAVGAPLSSVSRELDRLVRAGLLAERRVGRARLVKANADAPTVAPTTELVLHTFGPPFVLAEEFSGLRGAEEVYVFGSWAARYLGRPGQPPADVDVLVVGRPDRLAMYEAAQRAETRLESQSIPLFEVVEPGTSNRIPSHSSYRLGRWFASFPWNGRPHESATWANRKSCGSCRTGRSSRYDRTASSQSS
jgi:DNA-binding transcriptional ArsR family regulator